MKKLNFINLDEDGLIIVDIQNDFCPGGALGIQGGDEIIEVVNALIPLFKTRIFSRDWHPPEHCSFADPPEYRDGAWPRHCIAGTSGAEFHPALIVPANAKIINKAVDPLREAYSAFDGTDLNPFLSGNGIKRIFITGLATDYCVKHTALDALKSGYGVAVIYDAVKGVDKPAGSSMKALGDIMHEGACLVSSRLVLHGSS